MIKIRKIATYLMIGSLALVGKTAKVEASEVPIAGMALVLDDFITNTQNADEEITQYFKTETTAEINNLAFAQVTSYVNVRKKANEESEILGKLYNNSSATIIEKVGDWYRVKSGTVTGYINSEFLLTGKKADELAKTVGERLATVTTTTLKVREDANLNASVIALVPIEEELKVIKEQDGWVKVSIDAVTLGYVSADYVQLRTEFEEAVSMEEERERLEAEEAAREEEEQSVGANQSNSANPIRNVTTFNNGAKPSNTASNNTSSETTNSSALRSRVVEYALQFVGNPYVWGGTSLTNGADCSGFTQSVFRDKGISISRTSRTQATGGRKVSLDNIQPGDLIFYDRNGTINHVAIYIGNGKVISASSPQTGIRITSYNYRQPYKVVSYIN